MFKKKEKTEKAPKNKKVRTMKVGTHKKSVLLLWAVLLVSTSFGVYKNFTAINTHTVHEKEIIQLRLNDTNAIENFVKNFAKAYYSWDTSKEAIEARTTEISKCLTKELQDLNADTIRTDIPTSATVTNVLVWNVEQFGTDDFTVAYEVDQQVKEGEQTQVVTENYIVTVHVDKDGAMVITLNPTLAPAIQKSKYEPKAQEADVSGTCLLCQRRCACSCIRRLCIFRTGKSCLYQRRRNLKASVSVKYLDNKSKMTRISQYEFVLHKDDNWKIVE